MTVTTAADPAAEQRRDALAERLVNSLVETFELTGVYLGVHLGLYDVVRRLGEATPEELAAQAGIDARYAREWLEQQTAAGVVELGNGGGFTLPEAHAEVLLDPDSPAHTGAVARFVGSLAAVLPRVTQAYRTGEGIPYADYGPDCRDGIAGLNRPMFTGDLRDWVAAVPGLGARLSTGSARVLDLGCGAGWSSIALARAFPGLRVDGVDLDEASVADARRNAAAAGVGDRVTFALRDAAELAGADYDAAFIFEALHDMARPVDALHAVRAALAPGAGVLLADERVGESLTGPGDLTERLNYGFSIWHCLPATRAEGGSHANGTVLRPATARAWATEAGFSSVDVLPIENDFWRFYYLRD